jgi:hypothetical protein
MKKLFQPAILGLILMSIAMVSCKKVDLISQVQNTEKLQPRYSTLAEFRQGISQAINLIGQYNVQAYLDTLPNGYPNYQNGRKAPLVNFGTSILEKLYGNQEQVAAGVYDVFHFDGATFSLISYIRKAQMVGDISAQTMVNILALIPVPPIPVSGFQPPVEMVALNLGGGDCCRDNICNPKIKILVTWVHVAPCGNFAKGKSGYAAGDKFTGMPAGQSYRFTAEISGCPCPGTLTHTVTTPAGASYGVATGKDGSVDILPVTPGTYTITFTYTVCGTTVTKTFSLGVG